MKNVISFAALMTLTVSGNLFADNIYKANNGNNWNDNNSWVGGVKPGTADTVIYDNRITGFNNSNITSANASIGMLKILDPAGIIQIRDYTLTLNGINVSGTNIGLDMRGATQDLNFRNLTINTPTAQTWFLGGRTVYVNGSADPAANFYSNVTIADNGTFAITRNVTLNDTFNAANAAWSQLGGTLVVGASGSLNVTEVGAAGGTVNISANNRINTAATLRLGGMNFGTLTVSSGASQTFSGLTLERGLNVINSSGALTFTDSYNRSIGGFVNFVTSNVNFTNAPAGNGVYNNNGNTLLIGAVLDGKDFVQVNAANELAIVSYATNTFTSGSNTYINGNLNMSGSGNLTTQSLKFDGNGTLTLGGKLVIESGGILVPTASVTITGGTLTAGAGQSLWLYAPNGTQTIASAIVDNGSPLALELGANQTTLSGNNTFTGEIAYRGTLNINSLTALGTGSAAIRSLHGGEPNININVNNFTTDRDIIITKTGASFKIDTGANNAIFNGNLTFTYEPTKNDSEGMNFIKQGTGTLTLSGRVTDAPNLTINRGTLIITGTVGNGTQTYNVDGTENSELIISGNGRILGNGSGIRVNDNKIFVMTLKDNGKYLNNTGLNIGRAINNNDANTSILTLNIGNTAEFRANGDVTFGNNNISAATLNLNGSGTFASNNFTVNTGSGSVSVNVSDNARLTANGNINLATGSNANAVLTAGGNSLLASSNNLNLATATGGTAAVTLSGTAVGTVTNQIYLLNSATGGNASLTLQDDARLTTGGNINFNENSGVSTATLTVKGNSVLQTNGSIYSGSSAASAGARLTLNLTDSGTIRSGATGNNAIALGRAENSLTVINQTGGWLEGSLSLGMVASATVTYNLDGGILRNNGNIAVGQAATMILNGGTISQKSISSFQWQGDGNSGTILVGAGGAHMDVDDGILLYMRRLTWQHDSSLGTTADGGLVKTGSGKLQFDNAATAAYTGDTVIKSGQLQFAGGSVLTGGGALRFADNGGSFIYSDNALTVTGIDSGNAAAATIQNITALTLNGSGSYRYNGTIQNDGATTLTKAGVGTQEIAGTYNATGAVTVSNGVLLISTDINKSASVTVSGGVFDYEAAVTLNRGVTVSGGVFKYNSAAAYSGALTFTSGVISGTGNLSNTALTIGANRTISPGNNAGELKTGAQTWENGGAYQWEIGDLTGVAGTGWDLLTINGALTLNALAANGFTLTLDALSGYTAVAGDYTDASGNALKIVSVSGGINGAFNESFFKIENNIADFEGLELIQKADGLYLSFTVIPEPSTWALFLTGAALLAVLRRRRDL